MWYCRHEIQLRTALFFSAASIAGAATTAGAHQLEAHAQSNEVDTRVLVGKRRNGDGWLERVVRRVNLATKDLVVLVKLVGLEDLFRHWSATSSEDARDVGDTALRARAIMTSRPSTIG